MLELSWIVGHPAATPQLPGMGGKHTWELGHRLVVTFPETCRQGLQWDSSSTLSELKEEPSPKAGSAEIRACSVKLS